MTRSHPAASIVIPTHNRCASLERTLRALTRQSYPLDAIEVIVVADGCTDGTADLSRARWPFAMRVIETAAGGPAAARNRGALAATGELLLFLDDDIEAWPGLVAAHVRAHADGEPARVAIGYLPPDVQGRRDWFSIMLRAWWEAMFERMREPGHRFVYSDLLSGNFSVARLLFARLDGFDESLRCHEDYELGMRLIAAGARFQFVPDAAGWHHEHTDLARAFRRKRDEGQADRELARRHPALVAVLPLASVAHLTRRGRALRSLALRSPATGDVIEAGGRAMLTLLERARLRTRWRRLLNDLLAYWYWRGVGESLAAVPIEAVTRHPTTPEAEPSVLDLQVGLEAAMRQLDKTMPAAVDLRWGPLAIGTIAAHPGAEPLRGHHLPGLLRTRFAKPFADVLQALGPSDPALATDAGSVASTDRVGAAGERRSI